LQPVFPPGTRDLTERTSSYASNAAVLRWRIQVDGGMAGQAIEFPQLPGSRVDVLVRVERADGTERVLRPRHLVFANGVSSYPLIPEIAGLADFQGEVIHSEGFDSGAAWAGKKALIIGTGSELQFALQAQQLLAAEGLAVRVVSMPCTSVFDRQPADYRDQVLPPGLPAVAVETKAMGANRTVLRVIGSNLLFEVSAWV
jgi:hypothetical protein